MSRKDRFGNLKVQAIRHFDIILCIEYFCLYPNFYLKSLIPNMMKLSCKVIVSCPALHKIVFVRAVLVVLCLFF